MIKSILYSLLGIFFIDIFLHADFLSLPTSVTFPTTQMGEKAEIKIIGRNVTKNAVHIERVKASCGCTGVTLNSKIVPAGGNIIINVAINTNQKLGKMTKNIRVYYLNNSSVQKVIIRGEITPPKRFDHDLKIEESSIFSKDCRSCHVSPGDNKLGKDLYMTDCAFCHGTNRQGGYAPPLTNPMPHWYQIVTAGTNISMPGFLDKHGGPRSKRQIDSLMTFLKSPSKNPLVSPTEKSGKQIYRMICSMCHGSKQLGGIGPNLIEAKKNYTTDSLSKLLKEGTDHLMMPSFLKEKGGSMTEEEIDKLSEYLINGK